MNRLLTSTLWKDVRKLASGKKEIRGCVAYFTSANLLPFRKGDLLIVNASDGAIKGGVTSAKALRSLFNKGVELYSEPHLHAKILLVGDTAVVGSANLSGNSESHLFEAAVLTDDLAVTGPIRAYLRQLARKEQLITEARLSKLEGLPVTPHHRPFGGPKKREPKVGAQARTWVVALEDDPKEAQDPDAVEKAEKAAQKLLTRRRTEIDDFWWSGKHYQIMKLARPGDSVIRVWKRDKRKLTGAKVFLQGTIVARPTIGKRTYFFLEVPRAAKWHPWSQFERAAATVGLRPLGVYSARTITQDQAARLWDLLK